MNLQDFYKEIQGDYSDILSRLLKDDRIKKFVLKIPEKTEFNDLEKEIIAKNYENAFLIAHTLKGISLNLSFNKFTKEISELTELLRPKKVDDYDYLMSVFNKCKEEFTKTCELIKQID